MKDVAMCMCGERGATARTVKGGYMEGHLCLWVGGREKAKEGGEAGTAHFMVGTANFFKL